MSRVGNPEYLQQSFTQMTDLFSIALIKSEMIMSGAGTIDRYAESLISERYKHWPVTAMLGRVATIAAELSHENGQYDQALRNCRAFVHGGMIGARLVDEFIPDLNAAILCHELPFARFGHETVDHDEPRSDEDAIRINQVGQQAYLYRAVDDFKTFFEKRLPDAYVSTEERDAAVTGYGYMLYCAEQAIQACSRQPMLTAGDEYFMNACGIKATD